MDRAGVVHGKTIIVTGANSGIGRATAAGLAEKGAHVVMACRSAARGEEARVAIRSQDPRASLEVMELDLGGKKSICAFAKAFRKKHGHLDVLVHNAGLWNRERRITAEGLEQTFAVNHLGPFRLTQELLPSLQASAPSRILFVASLAHVGARVPWHDLQMAHKYDGDLQYANTKLYNIWTAFELARRLEGSGVTVNALHPGSGGTGLTRDFPGWIDKVVQTVLKSPETLAKTSIRLASSPDLEGVTGGYFHSKRRGFLSRTAKDASLARRLWDISEEMA